MNTLIKISDVIINLKYDNQRLARLIKNLYRNYIIKDKEPNTKILKLKIKFQKESIPKVIQNEYVIKKHSILIKNSRHISKFDFDKWNGEMRINESATKRNIIFSLENTMRHFFSHYWLDNDIIFLHGITCVHKNKAFLFLGKSGQGKTTIGSKLHKKGIRILNDDNIIIFKKGSKWLAKPCVFRWGFIPNNPQMCYGLFSKKSPFYDKEFEIGKLFFIFHDKKTFTKKISNPMAVLNVNMHLSNLILNKDEYNKALSLLKSLVDYTDNFYLHSTKKGDITKFLK